MTPPHPKGLPTPVGLALALVAGLAMAVQARVNGALSRVLEDGLAAAAVSFGTGLAVMVLAALLTPTGRAGFRAMRGALARRSFPLWYLGAGSIGAYLVMGQGVAVPLVGLALFTVAIVTGQTVGGLLIDRVGFGPGGRRTITGVRVIGAVLTVLAVLWTVSPRLAAADASPAWILPLLLPLTAGLLSGFQQAMNGVQTAAYGTPITATLVNFVAGTVVLLAALAVKVAAAGPSQPLPHEWWYYLGGPLGCVFIALGAVLVRTLGVLLTGLGMVAGQLLAALAIDVLFPAPGSLVTVETVLGTVLTLAAVAVASIPSTARMPWERGR